MHAGTDRNMPDEVETFLEWLCLPKNENWLLIFDNVDDLEAFDVRRYFPRTSHGNIIMTTRRLELTVKYNSINLQVMNEKDAISLLSRVSCVNLSETSGALACSLCVESLLIPD